MELLRLSKFKFQLQALIAETRHLKVSFLVTVATIIIYVIIIIIIIIVSFLTVFFEILGERKLSNRRNSSFSPG